jgi:hypothetical protein
MMRRDSLIPTMLATPRICILPIVYAALQMQPAMADEAFSPNALTFYAARISEERTWQHVLKDPFDAEYADAWLVAASYSRAYAEQFDHALRIEWEANVAWNFGDQDHFEVNFAPITLRWQRFPWSEHVRTTAAFGVGLSYALGRPEVEQAIEGDTRQLLIYWNMELTAGPRDGPWSIALRLHHRSTGWGLMGVDDGGMNAPGLGFRYAF